MQLPPVPHMFHMATARSGFDEIHPCAESQLEVWMPSDAGRQTSLTHWLNITQVYLENSNGM